MCQWFSTISTDLIMSFEIPDEIVTNIMALRVLRTLFSSRTHMVQQWLRIMFVLYHCHIRFWVFRPMAIVISLFVVSCKKQMPKRLYRCLGHSCYYFDGKVKNPCIEYRKESPSYFDWRFDLMRISLGELSQYCVLDHWSSVEFALGIKLRLCIPDAGPYLASSTSYMRH